MNIVRLFIKRVSLEFPSQKASLILKRKQFVQKRMGTSANKGVACRANEKICVLRHVIRRQRRELVAD